MQFYFSRDQVSSREANVLGGWYEESDVSLFHVRMGLRFVGAVLGDGLDGSPAHVPSLRRRLVRRDDGTEKEAAFARRLDRGIPRTAYTENVFKLCSRKAESFRARKCPPLVDGQASDKSPDTRQAEKVWQAPCTVSK